MVTSPNEWRILEWKEKIPNIQLNIPGEALLVQSPFRLNVVTCINISLSFAQNFVIFMLIWPYNEIFEILRCKCLFIFIFLLSHEWFLYHNKKKIKLEPNQDTKSTILNKCMNVIKYHNINKYFLFKFRSTRICFSFYKEVLNKFH